MMKGGLRLIILLTLVQFYITPVNAQDGNGFKHYKQMVPGTDIYIEMLPIQGGNYFIDDTKI